jgi:hypothetical protein
VRTSSLAVLAFSLLACGEAVDCPESRELVQPELLLWEEVQELVGLEGARPPVLAVQELDLSCPGAWDVRTPAGDCVGAFYAQACRCLVLPEGVEQAWPEYFAFLVRHESAHHALLLRSGNQDKDHLGPEWGEIRPPLEEE